jgi:hypothetical protein
MAVMNLNIPRGTPLRGGRNDQLVKVLDNGVKMFRSNSPYYKSLLSGKGSPIGGGGFTGISGNNKNIITKIVVPQKKKSLSEQLMADYQNKYNTARNANLKRYEDILSGWNTLESDTRSKLEDLGKKMASGYQSRYDKAMEILEGMGSQERADIMQNWNNLSDKQAQSLIESGFGNSTVMKSMRQGAKRQETADIARLEERLRGQKVGVHSDLSGDKLSAISGLKQNEVAQLANILGSKLGFMERREDEYPSVELYTSLMEALGKKKAAGNNKTSSGGRNQIGSWKPVKIKNKGQHTGFRRANPPSSLLR